jgi:CheY-like chemotaxis protein
VRVRLDNFKIVAVDDEEEVGRLLGILLSQLGARVRVCQDAEEALATIRQSRPDLVLCDICMPYRDGFELLSDIRALGASNGGDVPVIAVTGLGRDSDQMRTLSTTFQALLAKPFTLSSLLEVISEAIRKS